MYYKLSKLGSNLPLRNDICYVPVFLEEEESMLTPAFCPGGNADRIRRGGDRSISCKACAPFEAVVHGVVAANLADYGQMMLEAYHVSYLADAKRPARETPGGEGDEEVLL